MPPRLGPHASRTSGCRAKATSGSLETCSAACSRLKKERSEAHSNHIPARKPNTNNFAWWHVSDRPPLQPVPPCEASVLSADLQIATHRCYAVTDRDTRPGRAYGAARLGTDSKVAHSSPVSTRTAADAAVLIRRRHESAGFVSLFEQYRGATVLPLFRRILRRESKFPSVRGERTAQVPSKMARHPYFRTGFGCRSVRGSRAVRRTGG